MIRRVLIVAVVAVLAVTAGCVSPPRQFCFGEGGQVDECVSTSSRGALTGR